MSTYDDCRDCARQLLAAAELRPNERPRRTAGTPISRLNLTARFRGRARSSVRADLPHTSAVRVGSSPLHESPRAPDLRGRSDGAPQSRCTVDIEPSCSACANAMSSRIDCPERCGRAVKTVLDHHDEHRSAYARPVKRSGRRPPPVRGKPPRRRRGQSPMPQRRRSLLWPRVIRLRVRFEPRS